MHVIVGAGPTGSRVATLLAEAGERVRLLSRRGSGPDHPHIERRKVNANIAQDLIAASEGASTLYQCAMPAYDRWPEEFPPLAASILRAVEANALRYVMLGNLYGYGPVAGPLHAGLPLAPTTRKGAVRARMWEEARHSNATEVRASDFLGRDVVSLFTLLALPNLRTGATVRAPVDLDALHSWSCVDDVARTLIAAARSQEVRAWHVPSHELSWRALCARVAGLLGVPLPALESMPDGELQGAIGHEVQEMTYLYRQPCVIDAEDSERMLGVQRGDLDATLREMI